ncbi:ATP dependent DNA ligase domain-containing protein [Mucor lusitanicus]|uniref:DNA ligase 4 n=1 Tax=Mucor circinelloides f. lusitanicus TaxID=29924 RepID=A0A8H4BCE8_MUCCL|nr:ATP dependent DNA ligase domain-containing protein [Mucor lusitanicus]
MPSASPSFEEFCSFLEQLNTIKSSEKGRRLRKFISKWVENCGPDVYDAIRLLLPKGDERKYNLKEDKLASILTKALAIDPISADGIRLKKYKQPVAHNEKTAGNFPLIAFEEIEKRSIVRKSTQTVRQTNQYLDRLADPEKKDDQTSIFKEMLTKYTAQQMQWIIRIILKDMRIQCGERTILNSIYDGAYDDWTTNKSLQAICNLALYTEGEGSGTKLRERRRQQLQLFNMFIPQTCESFNEKHYSQLTKPFYVEKKLDGERVLMHYDKEKDQFLWHSRRRIDENYLYGSSSKEMNKLSSRIHESFQTKKVILDGEMLAYDPQQGIFLEFGTLKDAAKRDIRNDRLPHPCYVVFDILLVDDTLMTGFSFDERLQALDSFIKEQGMYLRVMPRLKMNTQDEINEELDKVLLNREEGLVIKDSKSLYQIAERSTKWLKYKPIYMDSLVDTCDLLLVGGKYGSGRLGGKLGSILCAVRDDRIPDTEPPRFATFTLAGGMKAETVRELEHLMKTKSKHDPKKVPDWMIHPRPGESFDQVVDYQDGIVVEVKGTEIVDSTKFGTQCTLRFPKYVGLRSDKGWQDVMTYSDVIKARSEGAVGKKRDAADKIVRGSGKKSRRGAVLMPSQQGINSSNVVQKTTIFEGKVFYVITGSDVDSISKNDLDLLIKENGGEYRQNKTAGILIAGFSNSRVKSSIEADEGRDILHPNYILDSIEAKKLLPITPKYMYYTSPKTRQDFLKTMDIYGDYYNKKIGNKDLLEIMDRMDMDRNLDDTYYRNLALETTERYFSEGINDMLFLNSVAYFDFDTSMPKQQPTPITMEWVDWKRSQENLELARLLFEFQAGRVATDTSDPRITHVVFDPHDLSRLPRLSEAFRREPLPRFVTLDWIHRSHKEEVHMDEKEFDPKFFASRAAM